MKHLDKQQLESGLDHIRKTPKDKCFLNLIVRRPETGKREVLETGKLDIAEGLQGDNWRARGNRHTSDGALTRTCNSTS